NRRRDDERALDLRARVTVSPRFAGDIERVEPSLAHLLTKLLVVSDNVAFNDCLEIVGIDVANRRMWQAGLESVRLWHRLSEARTLAENRQTRAVALAGTGGLELVRPARDTPIELANDLWHDLDCGSAWLRDGEKVDGPMSFAQKNAILLRDLQDLLVEVVRPEIDTGKFGFPELSIGQRAFLVSRLGMLPRESTDPAFDAERLPDHWTKFVLRGVRRVIPADRLRIYDKSGRAYGFSIENAFVEDTASGRGFFLAIVLYTNSDGVLNDDRYGYEEVADPVLDAIGEVIARAVLRP
ncbi:MAG: serine hydrolase, partial [Planctomycetes bacterium]|nr:serine hydrolase [Planctomycetota bacterium]